MSTPVDLAIPVLPSRAIEGTVAFYTRLGFEGGAAPVQPRLRHHDAAGH